jgi:hypothetical protein
VNHTTAKRKISACWRDCDRSSNRSDSPFEPESKRRKCLYSHSESRRGVAASTNERGGRSEEVCSSSPQPRAALKPEIVCRSTTKRKISVCRLESDSSTDSSDISGSSDSSKSSESSKSCDSRESCHSTDSSDNPLETERKRRKLLHSDTESRRSVAASRTERDEWSEELDTYSDFGN